MIWLLACSAGLAQGHWPQFRGPRASGLDASRRLPTQWNLERGENVRWKTALPGLAHSSPIVWSNRIYVATALQPGEAELRVGLYGEIESVAETEPQRWRLLALDLHSGALLWDVLGCEAVPRVRRHPKASHCNSTPATDGRHIAAIFGSEGLFCFDSSGRLLWHQNLGPMDSGFFTVPSAQWGFASSPVICRDRVIVQCDVQTNSFLAAFDVADGTELWRTPRRDVPTWSTPTIMETGGHTRIILNGWRQAGSYDFESGQEIWTLDGGGDIPVPTPVVAHDLVYLTSAHGRFRPMRAVRADAAGDITPPDPGATNAAVAWAHPRKGNYMQTPIVLDDLLWGCFDNGILTCFDARTGTIHYEERLSAGQGFTASPVSDGRHLYFASELGEVFVVPARPDFSVAATNQLGETQMASPALAQGTLLFRTRHHLVAIGNADP